MIEAYPLFPHSRNLGSHTPLHPSLPFPFLHIPCLFIYPIPPYLSPPLWQPGYRPPPLPPPLLFPHPPPSAPFDSSTPAAPFRYSKPQSSQTAHKAFTSEPDRRDKFQTNTLDHSFERERGREIETKTRGGKSEREKRIERRHNAGKEAEPEPPDTITLLLPRALVWQMMVWGGMGRYSSGYR